MAVVSSPALALVALTVGPGERARRRDTVWQRRNHSNFAKPTEMAYFRHENTRLHTFNKKQVLSPN
jgi:hypothetical protein